MDAYPATAAAVGPVDPVDLIERLLDRLAQASDRVILWTHYYDAEVQSKRDDFADKFSAGVATDYQGFAHTLYRQGYGAALGWDGFCGGSATYSHWMTRDDIIACCTHFGFTNIEISFDHATHVNGPAFCVAASR